MTDTTHHPPGDHGDAHGFAEFAHPMPWQTLVNVFIALLVLTAVTVIAANYPTGSWDAWIALGIATVKATLVALYFMHLRHDKSFNALVFLSALVFVGLFLGFVLMDTDQYQMDLESFNETAQQTAAP